MNELERILAKAKDERTEAELEYLKAHEANLTDEQKDQLAKEETPEKPEGEEPETPATEPETPVVPEAPAGEETPEEKDPNVVEEHVAEFVKKGLDKNIGKTIYRQFSSEVKDLGNGVMEAVISSEALDRHGERIDMKGMDVKEYMKNPVVAAFHNYDEPSVGRTLKLSKTSDGKLISKFEFAVNIYDKAKLLYNLYKDKFQYAFSIGFIPQEVDGNTYTKSTLLEFSPVLIPANPEALLLAKKKGLDMPQVFSYTDDNMLVLKEILAKEIGDLTVKEIAFLKEHASELSAEDKTKFASVLEEKDLGAEITKAVDAAVTPLKEAIEEIKKADPVVAKDINLGKFKGKDGEVTPQMKFLLYARGLQSGNFNDYIEVVGKDAMNTTDDGVLLPPVEFIAEVERLEEQYGVARRFAQVRRGSSGNGIKYLLGDDDVEIFDTAESGVKQSTKLSYGEKVLLWRKFAGILPITDELSEDSAIDLWQDATRRFARAFTKKEDELVFTEVSNVSPKNHGILNVAGTNVVDLPGDSFEDLDYDTVSKMIWGVPSPSADNGRFFLNREIVGVVQRIKDDEGRPIWQRAMADGTPATILGKPYEVTEVLPNLAADDAATKFMVFGDLRYSTLGERTGLDIVIRDTGTVGDPDEEDQDANTINLFTQDVKAMRAVKRMNAVCRFPAAFSVAKTASAS